MNTLPGHIQILPVEMNLKKPKWLVVAIYTSPSQCKSYFITELTKVLDKWRRNFENIVVLGDFNMEPTNQVMTTFIANNNFINSIKWNTRFKTSTWTCLDLILTNEPKRFQNTGVIETSVIDHHLLVFSFLITSFTKMSTHKLHYCKYKSFEKIGLLKDVSNLPEKKKLCRMEKSVSQSVE